MRSNCRLTFLFVNVAGYSQRTATEFHFTSSGAQACGDTIRLLLDTAILPESIAVITFYKKQYRLMKSYAQNKDIELFTVDSVRSSEDIGILLTTRLHFEADRTKFLNGPRRMNVAITSSKHDLIILGHELPDPPAKLGTTYTMGTRSRCDRQVLRAGQLLPVKNHRGHPPQSVLPIFSFFHFLLYS
ncbi:unnamed protein product [Heligmosomoides polygyrus]|uniref:AAA_12 domain-containing protein n=1 Tax=Heligmosomoides polygyrus TaxID=6339 RepID=A0A183G7N3_HELPZ|nr:unnamed protein product [Heligmosomoides polygyrus]